MSTWIETYSGRAFEPLDPRIEDIDIEDMIHVLAVMPRFTGHTRGRYAYSVGQHSIRVASRCPEGLELEGLLHDGTETWYHDIPAPLKHHPLFEFYRLLEKKAETLIAIKFKLQYPFPPIIKEIDLRELATEQRDLFGTPPKPRDPLPPPYDDGIVEPWEPEVTRAKFRHLFNRYKRT